MGETGVSPIKYAVIFLLLVFIVASLFSLPLVLTKAQNQQLNGQKQVSLSKSLTANTLCSTGLGGCETGALNQTQQVQQSSEGSFLAEIFGNGNGKTKVDPVITVVNVPDQNAVYRIINGKKHSMPTEEIFESYGFDLSVVQNVSQEELDKYPLARLFTLESKEEKNEDKTIYYLTDGGMIRPILNDKVFYSYGNRKEDIIAINRKELNFYPGNQFIFVERPKIDKNIYQISGGIKRYLTPIAVTRMNITENEIAPVNQIEFDEYPEGESVIF